MHSKKEIGLIYQKHSVSYSNKESTNYWSKYNDSELWEAFKAGHEGAFNHIYSTYFITLFRYGNRITQHRELILDCIQDLFIDLRENCTSLVPTASIKYFLFSCLRNKILYQFRKCKEKSYDLLDIQEFLDIQVSHEVNLINQSIDSEKESKLQQSLKKLSVRQKEAIYYYFYQGFSYKQLASIMKLKHIKSARNIIYKAIIKLKKDIKH